MYENTRHGAGGSRGELDEYPEFELECLFDDRTRPEAVTVFVEHGRSLVSHWITIDADHAVALEDVR